MLRDALNQERVKAGFDYVVNPAAKPAVKSWWQSRKDDIVAAIDRHGGNKTHAAKELGVSRSTVHEYTRRKTAKNVINLDRVATMLLMCAIWSGCSPDSAATKQAPPSTNAVRTVPEPPPMPEMQRSTQRTLTATNRVRWLRWDSDSLSGVAFKIYVGPKRGVVTNSFTTTSNSIIYQPGVYYAVATIDSTGKESGVAYWPSNRIKQYRARDDNGGDVLLEQFTNNPVAASRFWRFTNNPTVRIVEVATGWQ